MGSTSTMRTSFTKTRTKSPSQAESRRKRCLDIALVELNGIVFALVYTVREYDVRIISFPRLRGRKGESMTISGHSNCFLSSIRLSDHPGQRPDSETRDLKRRRQPYLPVAPPVRRRSCSATIMSSPAAVPSRRYSHQWRADRRRRRCRKRNPDRRPRRPIRRRGRLRAGHDRGGGAWMGSGSIRRGRVRHNHQQQQLSNTPVRGDSDRGWQWVEATMEPGPPALRRSSTAAAC